MCCFRLIRQPIEIYVVAPSDGVKTTVSFALLFLFFCTKLLFIELVKKNRAEEKKKRQHTQKEMGGHRID